MKIQFQSEFEVNEKYKFYEKIKIYLVRIKLYGDSLPVIYHK